MQSASIGVKLILLSVLISLGKPVKCQEDKAVTIDSMIHRANRLGVFNGNILIADGGKILYQKAIGWADQTHKTRLTQQHRFHIGSIAKEFNAVAIMLLKEQGKLNLDDKVAQYLPGLPAWAGKISILNLLQYTSGLPDVKWTTVKSDADNMQDLMALQQLDFEPGTNYAYNNNNVFLQRRIIEKITGKTFNAFVEEQLLKPCSMTNARVDPPASDALLTTAFNNEGKADSLIVPISGWTAVTLDDFYKWSQSISSFRLLSPEATKSILVPVRPNTQSGLGGGYMEGEHIMRHIHDGSAFNYNALLVSDPPKQRTVILMTNNKQGNLYELNTAIQAILDGKPYKQPKKSITGLLQKQMDRLGAKALLREYAKLKKQPSQEYDFDNESSLNEIGYAYLGKNRVDDAILIFEYNTKLFPASGNVFDSLGEAYYKKGDTKKALLNYKRSLELDPGNTNAKAIIETLGK